MSSAHLAFLHMESVRPEIQLKLLRARYILGETSDGLCIWSPMPREWEYWPLMGKLTTTISSYCHPITYTFSRGGIRGIVELEILRLIENVWGGGLRIQDFFDLIVGTR
jgi:hypothetical protein